MQPYPHTYTASASAAPQGDVPLASPELPRLATAPPREFGGPGNRWSPETLLVASIADCFVLTFRAVSRAARFEWLRLECSVHGVLDRANDVTSFTEYTTRVLLVVPTGTDQAMARKLLEKAERGCLISNSLRGTRTLETSIEPVG
jgi:organic hydroperoxide reductase OsmC/OhrA